MQSKKPKYRSTKSRNKSNTKISTKALRNFLIFCAIYILFLMILYGTADYYYPDPIPFIGRLYIDIATGIIYSGLAIWSIVSILILASGGDK